MDEEPQPARVGRPVSSPSARRSRDRRIALVALELFETRGVGPTTVAVIASAANISVRSFWRYFVSKEDAVRPLLEEGLRDALERLGGVARGQSFAGAWADPSAREGEDVDVVVRLLRLADREPAINAVWLGVHHDATRSLASVIARRDDSSEESLAVRVRAAVLNAALSVAIEYYASQNPPNRSISDVVAEAVHYAVD